MERIFALYDSDELYAARFMEYFKKKREPGFKLVVFTCIDSLVDYLQDNTIDILLLGENSEIRADEIINSKIKRIYRLADQEIAEHVSAYPIINKYQMIQGIISDIKADYMRNENQADHIESAQVKLVSIFSPLPELESLIFAWSAGLIMSEHKKVLFVSLEHLPVRLISTTDYSNQALTELIYYIKENNDLIGHIKRLTCFQGSLSYLAGIANGADILALSKEDVQKWVTALKNCAEYELVIFYICSNSEASFELMKTSNRVLYSSKEDLYAEALYCEWLLQMERAGVDLAKDKYLRIILPEEGAISKLPISIPELCNAECWHFARQHLDKLY